MEHLRDGDEHFVVEVGEDRFRVYALRLGFDAASQIALDQLQQPVADLLGRFEGALDEGEQAGGLREGEVVPAAHALEKSNGIHEGVSLVGTTKGIPPWSRGAGIQEQASWQGSGGDSFKIGQGGL